GHSVNNINISENVFPKLYKDLENIEFDDDFVRISTMMDYGNKARNTFGDHSILALGAIVEILQKRKDDSSTSEPTPINKTIHVIKSLKHPSEVERLRETYGEGFFLIGVHSEEKSRIRHLTKNGKMKDGQAKELLGRDFKENEKYGQHTSETFHLSDLFVYLDDSDNRSRLESSITRFVHILLSDPNRTPDFDEYAMYMAFSSSLRSADTSRQVGAVIGLKGDIVAAGANDCPCPNGGIYCTHHNEEKGEYYIEVPFGRDRELGHETDENIRGYDSNTKIKNEILDKLFKSIIQDYNGSEIELKKILSSSEINNITEYGRSVHAEMEALLSCARNGVSCVGKTLYTTTFPCHNCAKHIISSGINRVVYIEPYEKSKAIDLHKDAIVLGRKTDTEKVVFEQFIGVGPRRFFDLFSMTHGMGRKLKRKDKDGNVLKWTPKNKSLRFGLTPASYLEQETVASKIYEILRDKVKK
ncbi:MAG: anti-phage dCTP deaminase, partial [Nitrosopumilus sp.]